MLCWTFEELKLHCSRADGFRKMSVTPIILALGVNNIKQEFCWWKWEIWLCIYSSVLCPNYKGTSQLQIHIFQIKWSFWIFIYITLKSHNRQTKTARHNLEWEQSLMTMKSRWQRNVFKCRKDVQMHRLLLLSLKWYLHAKYSWIIRSSSFQCFNNSNSLKASRSLKTSIWCVLSLKR